MKSKAKIDAGVCGFKTIVTATSEDNMNVDLKIVSPCDIIKELAAQIAEIAPVNAYQDIGPQKVSAILEISQSLLMKKGCCEACIVPAGICKAMYVASGLALPKDATLIISSE